MDIFPYNKNFESELINFISLCYNEIGRSVDLSGKDKDLTDIERVYRDNGGNFFLALINGHMIGTIAIRSLDTPKGRVGEVRRFYVHPDQQKKGYGTKLLDFICGYAKDNGLSYLRGTTEYRLEGVISLVRKRGAYEIPQYRKSHAEAFFEWEIPENIPKRDFSGFAANLKESFSQLEKQNRKTLILNPVENYPTPEILFPCSSPVHGLYNTDTVRAEHEKLQSKIQFSGRDQVTRDVTKIYEKWAELLGAKALTMRLFSGLHAHIVMFMAITQINDKVLLLPEAAGGHMATKSILARLGLQVEEFPIDFSNRKVDVSASKKQIEAFQPKVIFVDRSEGLEYEDFSWLNDIDGPIKIFDGSQYLTNIITGDYTNPFEFGFDFILSTTHKNLPGPQRALICCKEVDEVWKQLKSGISTFVSNMHFHSIYSAGLLLEHYDQLQALSRQMLENTLALDEALRRRGVQCVKRNVTSRTPNTHHIWVSAPSRETAFDWYSNLESVGVLVNYRKLPYELGYGLRLGLSAATYRGIRVRHIEPLAEIVSAAMQKPTDALSEELQKILKEIDGEKNAEQRIPFDRKGQFPAG